VSYPIDCYEIARKLCYILVPYSSLTDHQLRSAMEFSSDGFSVLRKITETGMYRWFIFYNDFNNKQRQRWTIFHEIGHIYLGHFECDDLTEEEMEAEANFLQSIASLLLHSSTSLNANAPRTLQLFLMYQMRPQCTSTPTIRNGGNTVQENMNHLSYK